MNTTRPLIELFDKTFHIPAYQRGYRWQEQEVEELLNDLWDFQQTANNGEFYCLQPIVVRANGPGDYDLIDGQQRLTTLYLILVFLEERRLDEGYTQPLFRLRYETRADCAVFLEEQRFAGEPDSSNIDYFHICKAYGCIREWFAGHQGAKGKMTNILMDADGPVNRNVKLIWYEIETEANPIDAFIRLNIGKIGLTDAELVKALLLQADKYADSNRRLYQKRLFEIASEWDQIEYALQKDELWYFLNNKGNEAATHIDLIFDLIARKKQAEHTFFKVRPAKNANFLILSAYLDMLRKAQPVTDPDAARLAAVTALWEEVTTYYHYFNEWFTDRQLYHYIGFLIDRYDQPEIDRLIALSADLKKSDFIGRLESRIADTVYVRKFRENSAGEKERVWFEDLCYDSPEGGHDRRELQVIFLLHNVITTLRSDKELARFPFDRYKKLALKRKWSLEHIHARNTQPLTNPDHQRTWLRDHATSLRNLDAAAYAAQIAALDKLGQGQKIEQTAFDQVFQEVEGIYHGLTDLSEADIHKIGNLCLVDADLNSHLNNSVFDVKREKIKGKEREGHYIPICSRNAFLKTYTPFPVNNAYWTNMDRKAYTQSMRDTLDRFIKADWKGASAR